MNDEHPRDPESPHPDEETPEMDSSKLSADPEATPEPTVSADEQELVIHSAVEAHAESLEEADDIEPDAADDDDEDQFEMSAADIEPDDVTSDEAGLDENVFDQDVVETRDLPATPLTEEDLLEAEEETEPVDWTALASAGGDVAVSDVPDLSFAGDTGLDIDIDAALAAVDSLDAVVAAEQERKREEETRREAQHRADEEYRRWAESYVFRRPGMIRVQGGRVVTILPAVALMAVGAVLTLATASGQPVTLPTIGSAACAGISVSLLSYWLASGRWGRGALFAALMVAAFGGWLFAASLPDLAISWTVPFAALGAAFALTGLFGRPRSVAWVAVGLGIIAAAVLVPFLSQPALATAAPFVLIAVAVVAVLPLIFRTRRG